MDKRSVKVSVIIPSLDGLRGGNVEKLREQVSSQTYPHTEFLVIKGVRPNGRARNVGARQASGEMLLFIDDDVTIGTDALIENMLKAYLPQPLLVKEGSKQILPLNKGELEGVKKDRTNEECLDEDRPIGLVGVSQKIPENASPFAKNCARQLERFESPVVNQIEDTDFASHTCMMIPRDLYIEIGGENDLLPRGTDPDLRYRLRNKGYRIVLAPNCWAYHPPPENLKQLWKTYSRNGAGSIFVYRHFPQYSIDTAPRHQKGEVGKREFPERISGFISRFIKAWLPPKPIVIVSLVAYGCGAIKTLLFDKQQWSMAFRRDLKYALLPFGWFRYRLLKLLGRWPKGSIRILMYHRVEEIRRYPLVVLPENFKRQMKFLKEKFKVISLDEAVEALNKNNEPLRQDRFVITFDDGYRDNYTRGSKILEELNLPATVYLTTDYIGKETELPWMKKLGPPAYLMLDWKQVQQMKEKGFTIGVHTARHSSLATLTPEAQKEEIERSLEEMEDQIGEKAIHFAYPFGTRADYQEETIELLKEAGIKTAVTAIAGSNLPGCDLYTLRRTAIDPSDDFFLFRCHLKGYLDILSLKDSRWLGSFKRWLRKRVGI